MARRIERSKLRKQPRRRRTYSSSAVKFPSLSVPDTAKKRRRRQQTKGVRFGLTALKRILFSSRWVSLGLLALTLFALVIIAQERRFYLTYIPVEGAVSFPAEDIVKASGLAGIHIFSADPSKAATEITELPGVISSTVSLKWPNQVYIEIAEEAPVAIWQEDEVNYGITSGGRLIPIGFPMTGLLQIIHETSPFTAAATSAVQDDVVEGEDFGGAEETAVTDDIPAVDDAAVGEDVVTAEEEASVEEDAAAQVNTADEGDSTEDEIADASAESEELATARDDGEDSKENEDDKEADSEFNTSIAFVPQNVLLGALSLRELRPAINELYYQPSEGLSFQDGRGWRVHFGTGTDMNQKLVIYEAIVSDLITRGVNPVYISVSNKNKPYYLAQ